MNEKGGVEGYEAASAVAVNEKVCGNVNEKEGEGLRRRRVKEEGRRRRGRRSVRKVSE